LIEEVIQSVGNEGQKEKLIALQASWDKRMRGAGSAHNRFVLARLSLGPFSQYLAAGYSEFRERSDEERRPLIRTISARPNSNPSIP